MITIVAFVINIGLFVKAKINLQNATDAAAYAGASVQARQLSKIAYLNWEMRNVYKEWLYKYYVVGNLNIKDVENPPGSGAMKFQLDLDEDVLSGDKTYDQFNIPAVCIHLSGSKTNICKRYSIPGLPEFGSSILPGAEEASRAFMDTLISTKVNDCIDRSRLNMIVANNWTYNVLGNSMDDSLAGQGPAVLSDRQGAWPRAMELALRIRNLEYVMNRSAEQGKICISGSTNLTNCSRAITDIEQEKKLGNERIVKAFYSGYRNLGNEDDSEMKATFTLTELPPKVVKYDSDSNASNLLIPNKSNFREKQWVDLKLMMVNYAIFYAAMIPRANRSTSGACDVSKVAIPVPGYPLGFYKDPEVLTYYAVKGEAEFVGMFNPFTEEAVKLQAYSAAKPMGGRIGPMLFNFNKVNNSITARTDNKRRSIPYITSYDFENVKIRGQTYNESTGEKFIPGLPLPTNSRQSPGSFWLDDPQRPVGGMLANPNDIQFGVPNMVYDYQVNHQSTGYTLLTDPIFMIKSASNTVQPVQPVGLFSAFQFKKFRGNALSSNISPQMLDQEIARIRAPTLYESANYMIPTPNKEMNLAQGLDAFGFISQEGSPEDKGAVKVYNSRVYAPLYKTNDQQDLIFNSSADVTSTIFDYMRTQQAGMTKYRMAMNRAAINIFNTKVEGAAIGSAPGYEKAAKGVSDIDFKKDVNQMPQSCSSLAGQFLYFYFGEVVEAGQAPAKSEKCPVPLGVLIQEYYSRATSDVSYDPNYYALKFSYDSTSVEQNLKMMTAYMPGPYTGSDQEGIFSPLSGADSDTMRRNFYSTKFVTLDSLQTGGSQSYDNKGFAIHSEGDANPSAGADLNTYQETFKNPLEVAGEDLSSIKY